MDLPFYPSRRYRRGGPFIVSLDFGFLIEILKGYLNDPAIFLTVLFVYAILTAVILPIPVELALLNLLVNPGLLGSAALVLGLGKMLGASLIFVVGLRVEEPIRVFCARHPYLGQVVGYLTRFVRATRWWGLLILLSIPLMSDTVPIYLYSLFNKQGQFISSHAFLAANFLAGVLRALIFVFLASLGFTFIVG